MARRRPHQPRSGFPDVVRSVRERQELLVSHGLVAVLQLGITGTLVVAALQTYRMWRQGVPYLPQATARMVPVLLSLGAAIAMLAATRSVRRVRTIQRLPLQPPPEP
jgi:hypothetical protein